MKYGLTKNGFIVKPFEVILNEEIEDFKIAFGNDIDVSPESVAGAYLYNSSIKISQLWEILGGLYTISDKDSAVGIYLDRLGSFLNIQRKKATYTTVNEVLWGKEETVIPTNHLLKDINNNLFALRNSIQLTSEKIIGIELKISTNSENSIFDFVLQNKDITYTAIKNDTKQNIRNKLEEKINTLFPDTFSFDNSNNDILKFWQSESDETFSFLLVSEDTLEIKNVGNKAIYDSQVAGKIFVGERQLTQIVNALSGLNEAVNYIQGETGSDTESDDEFRLAFALRQKNASGNETSIENAIAKLDDVQYVKVYSNRTMNTLNGRPPKSFEVVVQGGDDDKIASTIFNTGPAGIQPYGSTNIEVYDNEGFKWVVGFTRPTTKYLWIKIKYALNSEESPSENIPQGIKDNLIAWGTDNLNIGTDIIFQKMYKPIYEIDGIATAEIKLAVSENLTEPEENEFKTANISIAETEIALIDSSRITVELEV